MSFQLHIAEKQEMGRVDGKVVVLSAAAQGIGRASAEVCIVGHGVGRASAEVCIDRG